MRVFIGMETSGALRNRFLQKGHDVCSVDILPAQDGNTDNHVVGDVFEVLNNLKATGWWPDLAIFHPTCTYLTGSAEWAYSDGPYHQKVKPGTLVGAAGAYDVRLKVTDKEALAQEIVRALNDEEEDGTTSVHSLFDKAVFKAFENGAEGVEEHPNQEF